MIQLDSFVIRPYKESDSAAMSLAVRESTETVGKWMSWARPDFSQYDEVAWG